MKELTTNRYIGYGRTNKVVRRTEERSQLFKKLKVSWLIAIAIAIVVLIGEIVIYNELRTIAIVLFK